MAKKGNKTKKMEQNTKKLSLHGTLNKLKHPSDFSKPQLAVFVLAFALIGYLLVKAFAAAPLVASLQSEQMTPPSGTSVVNDSTASGGQAIKMTANGTASGSVSFPSSVNSLTVIAKGDQCQGSPVMSVKLDSITLLSNTSVSATSWTAYSVTPSASIASGTHSLSISFTNAYSNPGHGKKGNGACTRSLYADVTNFYGPTTPPPPAPTVALSASPTSVTSGQSSTLTWSSTNATACTASGAWSGSEPTSGSVSTGALNQNSTYSLSCTGSGGTATASATVTVTASSSLSFESASGFARPSPGTPSAASSAGWRLVPFSTKAGLDSAITNMQGHDYIYYNGTGVMTISSSSATAYSIHGKNPTSPAVIDFGAARDIWDSSKITPNYVKIIYTGTGESDGLLLYNDSNLRIFGGEFATSSYGHDALRLFGGLHDVVLEDSYLSMSGASGVQFAATDPSTGAASSIYNLIFRSEIARFSMNPATDNHADKGTGYHGAIVHGNTGSLHDITFAVYAHDPLRPGETSAGKTWPEGGGGSACEFGQDGGSNYNFTIYCKGENMLMIPNGTNPGSTAKQTGGNDINAWGNDPFNNFDFKWIEGINMTGAVFHGAGGSWYPGTPAILVEHGRHNKTNQLPNLGNIGTNPYQAGFGINYQDCL
jgi:hypothetical protein